MEDELRAPIAVRRERLIDDVVDNNIIDYSSDENDSDNEMDQFDRDIARAIERSLKDRDPEYWEKKRLKMTDDEDENTINSFQSGKYNREEEISDLKQVLNNPEYKDLKMKLDADITLYEEGIMEKMELTCENYYELVKLFELYFVDDNKILGKIIVPMDLEGYSVYHDIMENSKKDIIDTDAVEIKRRKDIFKPLFVKIDILKGYEQKVKNLEIILKNNNEDFFVNKKNKIELCRQNYDEFKQLLKSIRNEDVRKEIKKYIQVVE